VKDHLKFHFVNNVDEVLKIAVGAAKLANGKHKLAAAVKSKERKVAAK
jgi:hypothetical protein